MADRRLVVLAAVLVAGTAFNVGSFGALLFLPLGGVHWWRGWALLGVLAVGCLLSTLVVHRVNPSVLAERARLPIQREQPLSDKLVLVPFLACFYGVILLAPLDRFRWHLLPRPSLVVSALGLAGFVIGWTVVTVVLCQNAFAAPVVKHQADRQQRVIDRGLYGVVRHPMYLGALPLLFGMPLWLESYAAALFAVIPAALLAVRIVFEERFLCRTLDGYDDYRRRVRYRLVPGVW